MKKAKRYNLEFKGREIPVQIFWEPRRNVRAALGKRHFILRMPLRISKKEERKSWQWFEEWVVQQLRTNERVRSRFFRRQYSSGDTLQVGKRQYQLDITYADRKTHTAKLKAGTIFLKLSRHVSSSDVEKSIRTLLSRTVAQDFLPEITERVHALNQQHFRKEIVGVHLKYNHSNWGSSSTRKNINLSTRLLFAPNDVIDYIIIHELAHLVEMNHSARFWKLVEKAMPEYKEKERWLKEHGAKCDF